MQFAVVSPDYQTVTVSEQLEHDLRAIVRLAIAEDLRDAVDWTTVCLIPDQLDGSCQVVSRQAGVCAGLVMLPWIVDEFDADLQQQTLISDGDDLVAGQPIATLSGNVRDLLTSERTILNILARLCGIATLTRQYVQAIGSAKARLYDTRKTTPGWRLMEKYAVHCGGAHNHRSGLHDGFLVKDNHLALAGDADGPMSTGVAAERALKWKSATIERMQAPGIVEIEVDSMEQLEAVLKHHPDIVLLDNFSLEDLAAAVRLRDEIARDVELEASGNVRIDTIAQIAATGVERISSGALTHQATSLDLGLDWLDTRAS